MQVHRPTYEEAISLLKEFNENESLLRHAYSVEAVMRYVVYLSTEIYPRSSLKMTPH